MTIFNPAIREVIRMFETFEEAAEALLHTTCGRLKNKDIKFVIVGGWSPYLRGRRTDLRHPGTRDVDVLFADEDRSVIEYAIKAMLDDGFSASAKHAFQLLRPLQVGGRDFVFNVDFMHPSEQRSDPELMADIFDLGVPDESDPTGRRWFKSIVFQSAQIVFDHQLFSIFDREGNDVDGRHVKSRIPLLDETGLVLSKLNSVKQVKRPRDSFDIFYMLSGSNGISASKRIKQLARQIDEVDEQLQGFFNWLETKANVFDANVARYMETSPEMRPSSLVSGMLKVTDAKV